MALLRLNRSRLISPSSLLVSWRSDTYARRSYRSGIIMLPRLRAVGRISKCDVITALAWWRSSGHADSARTQRSRIGAQRRDYNHHSLTLASTYCTVVRPHRSTTYVDAAYSYRPSSVVCLSVCLSVCHTSEPCKNGCTDRAAFWVEDLMGGPGNHVLDGSPDPPMGRGKFFGENGVPL